MLGCLALVGTAMMDTEKQATSAYPSLKGRERADDMSTAICFKCGAEKPDALVICPRCHITPRTHSEFVTSLALSGRLSSEEQLLQYSRRLRSGLKASVPPKTLVQALDVLKGSPLMAALCALSPTSGSESLTPAPANTRQPPPIPTATTQQSNLAPPQSMQKPSVITTLLHKSPFAVLGATIRDDRRRIVELAEEKSLELDYDLCQKARSDLTNPRTRLGAEIAWLPGVSPRKAIHLVDGLLSEPMAIREESGLPTLAHLNLLAAAFETVDDQHDAEDVASFIQEIAYLAEDLDLDEVLRDINEDRSVSGFPEVRSLDQIEAEIAERKRYYRGAVKGALDRMLPAQLVQVMTDAVDGATAGGEDHAPGLIDDLVDSYEVETQEFLQKEAENVHKLIKAVRDLVGSGEAGAKPYVDKLDAVARNWDKIAQPIQLSAKARGIDHESSEVLAYAIRDLAIELYNKHGMLGLSQQLTALGQELFNELPEVSERLGEDATTLDEISENKARTEAQEREWERSITHSVDIGAIFKDTFSISAAGITWKGQRYPLGSITRIRWGGVRHSTNGIPTGTTYTIAFGDQRSEAVVELRKEATYSTLTDKLWRAVCLRLIGELVEALKAGDSLRFGDAVICDDHVILQKHKVFGRDEAVRRGWGDVHVWSADGSFFIGAKNDKKTYVGLSYILSPNTHILEPVIRTAFKHSGNRLSDAF